MDELPSVAAIVPTFNRCHKLLRFLDLIHQQTYPNLQVIVVDSSSTDGTKELVRRYPYVTLVEVSDRNYWAGATNAGVRLAIERQVDFIFTINDDAIIEPSHLERLVNLARKHQLSIVGNRIDYLVPKDKVWSLGTYSDWGTERFLKIAYNNYDLKDIPHKLLELEIIPVDTLPGNGVLIDRTVFEQVGLYDTIFCPHYHADSELIMRAKKQSIATAWLAPNIVLKNDFNEAQKRLAINKAPNLMRIFFHPKSHLFITAILSIIWKYCPRSQKIPTLVSLIKRFLNSILKK